MTVEPNKVLFTDAPEPSAGVSAGEVLMVDVAEVARVDVAGMFDIDDMRLSPFLRYQRLLIIVCLSSVMLCTHFVYTR